MILRQRVTLLIVRDEKLLVIRRWRNGRSFIVIPGGGVEDGETLLQAACREAQEETNLMITPGICAWSRQFTTPTGNGDTLEQIEHAYLITKFTGTPRLNPDEFPHLSPDNHYQLDWITLAELHQTSTYPGPFLEQEFLSALLAGD